MELIIYSLRTVAEAIIEPTFTNAYSIWRNILFKK